MSKHDIQVTCNNCSLDKICFPRGLTREEISNISQVIQAKKTLHRGDCLFRQGDDFRGILAIKSGSAKLVAVDHHGNEHILKILLPGELLGFDGLYDETYQYSAIALETLSFCELPAQSMNDLFQNKPALTRELFRHGSEQIKKDKDFIVLSKRPAEERLAHFLIDLSDRMKRRGFSCSEFTLSLTRQEIGNHLNLAMETVSRLLKKFHQQELIVVNSQCIELKNIPELRAIFAHSE
jgi:CRP/FNR family transcriptional regulator